MATETVTITRRSRNLGFSWSNSCETRFTKSGHSYLVPVAPEEPQVVGSFKAIDEEYDRACYGNRGNDWAKALFVGGRRVVGEDSGGINGLVANVFRSLHEFGNATVQVEVKS